MGQTSFAKNMHICLKDCSSSDIVSCCSAKGGQATYGMAYLIKVSQYHKSTPDAIPDNPTATVNLLTIASSIANLIQSMS